VFEVAGQKG